MNDTSRGPGMGVQREVRIDFLRGIMLLLIFIGHAEFTFSATFQHSRGFADASELFFLLAGMSSALAYYRPGADFAPTGPWRRAWRIYLAHLLLFLVMGAFGGWLAIILPPTQVAGDIAGFVTDPVYRGLQAIFLSYMPGNLDILPTYVALMLWVPVVFLLHDRHPLVLAAISAILWLLADIGHVNLSNHAELNGHWFFDPLSWQVIFTIGILFGIRIKTGRDPMPYHQLGFALAGAFVIIAVPVNLVVYWDWVAPPFPVLYRELVSKTNSGPLRIMDALAILYLVWNIEAVRGVAGHAWLRPICMLGRHSLPVFAAGIFLSAAASAYMDLYPHASLIVQMAILTSGCAIQLILGRELERRRKRMLSPALQIGGANPA